MAPITNAKHDGHSGSGGDHDHYAGHFISSDDDIERENHFTSTWAVHVPGGEVEANRVAAQHGFDNLGEVSAIFLSCFSHSRSIIGSAIRHLSRNRMVAHKIRRQSADLTFLDVSRR